MVDAFLYDELGKRIRKYREAKGWTQLELSMNVQLTRTSIANIESGRQRIQVHQLYKFAEVLGVPPFELTPTPDELSELSRVKQEKELVLSTKEIMTSNEIEWIKSTLKKVKEGGNNDE
jgi:transcriptional regulator with XRE-family HTH domain